MAQSTDDGRLDVVVTISDESNTTEKMTIGGVRSLEIKDGHVVIQSPFGTIEVSDVAWVRVEGRRAKGDR